MNFPFIFELIITSLTFIIYVKRNYLMIKLKVDRIFVEKKL
jgi:hypothetical protein